MWFLCLVFMKSLILRSNFCDTITFRSIHIWLWRWRIVDLTKGSPKRNLCRGHLWRTFVWSLLLIIYTGIVDRTSWPYKRNIGVAMPSCYVISLYYIKIIYIFWVIHVRILTSFLNISHLHLNTQKFWYWVIYKYTN